MRARIYTGFTIVDTMNDPNLFARWFSPGACWNTWRVFLAALFGLPMSDAEAATFRQYTSRRVVPTTPALEKGG